MCCILRSACKGRVVQNQSRSELQDSCKVQVWTFIVNNALFKINQSGGSTNNSSDEIAASDKVKIVCVDARLSGLEH